MSISLEQSRLEKPSLKNRNSAGPFVTPVMLINVVDLRGETTFHTYLNLESNLQSHFE